ncbi:hypothetical protein M378DRAFT_160990 [Amanita muscaria Koide BX008]|uniref:Uncharacterized protein n=1 Tax=Amanita muscaria (strain Koide BX008) TaxID=946122 RepID=A0A0C2RZ00_AMAMK|nr:hypothetical protein M378DRAFT_173529 [Amanita muscaria Koide BX008]KIL66512.1 hypothetical protein M378DRAFT_160990 [Amanita muscaria Koide BX008]
MAFIFCRKSVGRCVSPSVSLHQQIQICGCLDEVWTRRTGGEGWQYDWLKTRPLV